MCAFVSELHVSSLSHSKTREAVTLFVVAAPHFGRRCVSMICK